MEAVARIVAESDGDGRTRLAVCSGEPPLLPRRTGPRWTDGAAEVHLVGGAAGPLGGDILTVRVAVGPGAALVVRTVAASMVLPALDRARSQVRVEASVAAGGRLEWLPEPLIASRGCHHLATSLVELAAGAELSWREEVVCGRYGEESGDLTVVTAVRLDGEPLYQQELTVGPAAPAWSGPAILGGMTAAGCLLVVDPRWTEAGRKPTAFGTDTATASVARMPLAGPAVLTSAVAADAHELRKALLPAG
jgi:urease accessory protein